jgi:hypothetical protein
MENKIHDFPWFKASGINAAIYAARKILNQLSLMVTIGWAVIKTSYVENWPGRKHLDQSMMNMRDHVNI